MAQVKFVSCSLATYSTLESKDAGTLYFVTDERRLYKGEVPFSGGIFKAVASYPETGDVNTIYANTTDGSVQFWNGTSYVVLVKPQPAAITGDGLASELATTKAVVDYVSSKVADLDVGALEGRVKANEDAIGVINGSGAGSISKALEDAKAYTDALADGAVATNTVNIALLDTAKADKATTLEGYGITDAYTRGEADTAIAAAVAAAGHLKRSIVDALPKPEEAEDNVIYMVPKTGGSGDQQYDEYMLINGALEKIGDSAVSLDGYATEDYADGKAAAAETAAKTYADGLIAGLDVEDAAVEHKYVSAVSETDGKIAVSRVELPVYSVEEGTTNGSIAVNGADVAVHGLGSAAFTASSAYATADQGVLADSALQAADIATGTTNGTISVDGADVAVKGLGSAAYTEASAYDAAGEAGKALSSAKSYADDQIKAALTWEEL